MCYYTFISPTYYATNCQPHLENPTFAWLIAASECEGNMDFSVSAVTSKLQAKQNPDLIQSFHFFQSHIGRLCTVL